MTLHENDQGYLKGDLFKTIIDHTPLVSVDLIVKQNAKILLGKRVNKPAQGYWFTIGGRVLKNESIQSAIMRIANIELGIIVNTNLSFIGVFEHLYNDSIFDNISTHYINLAYEIEVSDLEDLPKYQHDDYYWFDLEELIQSSDVHAYVKDYFSIQKGTVPQEKEKNV